MWGGGMQQDPFLCIVPALATEAIGILQFYFKLFTLTTIM